MHERMLNKQQTPTFEDMLNYSGESAVLWRALDAYMKEELGAAALIRFPYGKDYGWAVKYSRGTKHICDVFAEQGAFAVFGSVPAKAFEPIYEQLGADAKRAWDEKYPCGSGGWIAFRVTTEEHLRDAKIICRAKAKGR